MKKRLIRLFLLTLVFGTCFIIQSNLESYASESDFKPTITVLINGSETNANETQSNDYGDYNLVITDLTVDVIEMKIYSPTTAAITFGGINVANDEYFEMPTLEKNNDNIFEINVSNGLETYNYELYVYVPQIDLTELTIQPASSFTFKNDTILYNLTTNNSITQASIRVRTNLILPYNITLNKTHIGINGNEIDFWAMENDMGLGLQNIPLNTTENQIIITVNYSVYEDIYELKSYTINITKQAENNSNTGDTGGSGGGGTGGGGGSSTPPPVDTNIDPTTNTVVVSISQTQLASLFEMLEDSSNEVKLAIIKIPKVSGLDNYGIQLPYSAFTASNSSGIRLETDIGTLTLMDTMLQDVVQTTDLQNVKFNMGYVDKSTLSQEVQDTVGNHPIIRLNMELDGTTTEWNNPNSPVIISVPYTPTAEELADPEKIVVYYIDGQGNVITIPNGKYDSVTGQVVFTTTHFSDYAVGFGNKTFLDITNKDVKHAVEVLAAKGIVNGKTSTEFKSNDVVTRAEFITMISRAFELNADFTENFTDVDLNKYYYKSVGIAKELEIVNGVGDNKFNPNGILTKEQIKIIIGNVLKVKGDTTTNLDNILSWIDDIGGITRDETCLMIYNLIK
jgi:hypothetical protein